MAVEASTDGGLGIVGLHEPVLALHDAALRIGKVPLGFGIGFKGGRGSFRPGFPAPLGLPLRRRRSLYRKLGFGRSFRVRLQFRLGLTDLLGTALLVSHPLRHLVAGLVAAVLLVLLGVRRFS